MTSYTRTFGGTTILPTVSSYISYTLTANLQLEWPNELADSTNSAAAIIDVNATVGSLTVTLPDATQISVGQTVVFTNTGGNTFSVNAYGSSSVVSVAVGTTWTLYCYDNSTSTGSWRAYQNGAGTSTAVAGALAGLGIKAISTTLNQSMPVTDLNSNYTPSSSDRAKVIKWTGGAGTITLPLASAVGNDWFLNFRNSGSGTLTINRSGSDTINGATSFALATEESMILICDGTSFFTLGYGRSVASTFTLLGINVAGTGNYTLSTAEQNKVGYLFTGVLTGNRSIIVPNSVAQYWIDNETSGAFTLTVKTAAGTGIVVPQSNRYILYCDGTNVVDADTATMTSPVAIADGGTGATTAPGALINLGGTSPGITIFTAASVAAIQSYLGITGADEAVKYAVAMG